jgi:hypothetical protein
MERQSHSNGWETFLEHWGTLIVVAAGLLAGRLLWLLMRLTKWTRLSFLVASFILMIVGGWLIGYAKFPVYRQGRLFTLGAASVPEQRRRHYRWGWRMVLFGAALAICLLVRGS